jgi:hypothetical protein
MKTKKLVLGVCVLASITDGVMALKWQFGRKEADPVPFVVGSAVVDPQHLERMDAFRKLNTVLDPVYAENLSSTLTQLGTFRGDVNAWKSDLTAALRKGLARTINSIGESVLLAQLATSNPDEAMRLEEIGLFNWADEVELNGQFDPMFALLEKNANAARKAGDQLRAELNRSVTKEAYDFIMECVSSRDVTQWDKYIIAQRCAERMKTPVREGEADDLVRRVNKYTVLQNQWRRRLPPCFEVGHSYRVATGGLNLLVMGKIVSGPFEEGSFSDVTYKVNVEHLARIEADAAGLFEIAKCGRGYTEFEIAQMAAGELCEYVAVQRAEAMWQRFEVAENTARLRLGVDEQRREQERAARYMMYRER